MRPARVIKWLAAVFLVPVVLAALLLALFQGDWLRGPLERMTAEKTGRVLAINGGLKVEFGWPLLVIHAGAVTFANPEWARAEQMVVADTVAVAVDLPHLLREHIVLAEVRLERPVLFLEKSSDGRKNWLLDLKQQDEDARLQIKRLTLDHGKVGYDDAGQKTSIRMELSTSNIQQSSGTELTFAAQGRYQGLPLKLDGKGGPVLGLRDEGMPYPLQARLTVGHTVVKAEGTITSLLTFSALDLHLALSGDSLAQLYPLLGIAFPETRAYVTEGHLVHGERVWRYERFSGRIGDSDIAGTLQVDTGGKRPAMTADLVSSQLDLADLGPLIGARPGSMTAAKHAAQVAEAARANQVNQALAQPSAPTPAQARLLPDMPFKTERWGSVDAEVTLKAKAIRRDKEVPLKDLLVHLSLRDSLLRLDPLDFGVAGGHLEAVIALDGRQDPIRARAHVRAKRLLVAQLLPTVETSKTGSGELNGEFDLAGQGNSVRGMLASSNGKMGMIIAGGEISRLMMEEAGLHLWEVLELNVTGDKLVRLRCGVANFAVKQGTMYAEALVFDTEVTTIIATGSIDLGEEKLDLTLNQKTKRTSPVALRSPIYVRGSFARPEVEVDKRYVAVRVLSSIALGIVNPLLALIPLIDAGPGMDSDCGQLVRTARAMAPTGKTGSADH